MQWWFDMLYFWNLSFTCLRRLILQLASPEAAVPSWNILSWNDKYCRLSSDQTLSTLQCPLPLEFYISSSLCDISRIRIYCTTVSTRLGWLDKNCLHKECFGGVHTEVTLLCNLNVLSHNWKNKHHLKITWNVLWYSNKFEAISLFVC